MNGVSKKILFILVSCASVMIYCSEERKYMNWSEFSFILKPSQLGGIGVFATHDIAAGTPVFTQEFNLRTLKIKEVPEELIKYCIYTNDEECLCPERFDRMEIGWYLNHSSAPNIARKSTIGEDQCNDLKKRDLYAIKDIKAGDEILIDYNYLNEPEEFKEEYYRDNK